MPIRVLLGAVLLTAADYGTWEWALGHGQSTVAVASGLALPLLGIVLVCAGALCAASLLSRLARGPGRLASAAHPSRSRARGRLPIG